VVRSRVAHQLDAVQSPTKPLDSGTSIPASCGLPCSYSIAMLMQDCAGSRLVPTLIASIRPRPAIRLRVISAPQVIVNT
jgi:hypothetical protein